MAKVYMCMGDDTILDAKPFPSKRAAMAAFWPVAEELARIEQFIQASIHYADNVDELVEDADFVMWLGPRGGLHIERA